VKSKGFTEIWQMIMNSLNEIIKFIKPRKLIFLALDGVPPRAKTNQSRSRRFLAAKSHKELDSVLSQWGHSTSSQNFKNNSITPGTEFMYELNECLKYFVLKKIEEDVGFKDLKVIVSGSDVPGEGEHKILEFIKQI
jgi:5'-3' exoribonuclease 1